MSGIQVTVAGLSKRAIIPVNGPSSPLYQILEDFCKKNNMDPSKYELKTARRATNKKSRNLDLSLPWRLSGLQNHTELEIAPKKVKSGAKATIGFQLHDGSRYKEVIPVEYTLWQCLRYLERNHVSERVNVTQVVKMSTRNYCIPVVIVMNNHYNTLEMLGKTTLAELGLSDGGNILLRISFQETNKTFEEMVPVLVDLNNNLPVSSIPAESNTTASNNATTTTSTPAPVTTTTPVATIVDLDQTPKLPELLQQPLSPENEDEDEEDALEASSVTLPNTVATNVKLYYTPQHGPASSSSMQEDTETDEDFQLKPHELKRLLAEQERKKEEQNTLKTRKMRDLESEKKKRVYDQVIIRIRFPTQDGLIIQGTFKPQHTLQDVYNFALQVMSDSQVPFYMFIAPPVQKFSAAHMSKSLQELGLVPAAIVNINVDRNDPASQQHSELTIKPDLLQYLRQIEAEALPTNLNAPQKTQVNQSPLADTNQRSTAKPKWFKP